MDRAEKYLKKNTFRKNVFFTLIVFFSLSITAVGFAFAGYVLLILQEVKQLSMSLPQSFPSGEKKGPITSPEQLAGMVGENTIWVPIVAGLIVILLAVIYLFRIYVRRVVEFEDELIRLEKFKALSCEDAVSTELEAAVLASSLQKVKYPLPAITPTIELAEKSIKSIGNLMSRSSNIAGRFRRGA